MKTRNRKNPYKQLSFPEAERLLLLEQRKREPDLEKVALLRSALRRKIVKAKQMLTASDFVETLNWNHANKRPNVP